MQQCAADRVRPGQEEAWITDRKSISKRNIDAKKKP
jgi:hypothetical protein